MFSTLAFGEAGDLLAARLHLLSDLGRALRLIRRREEWSELEASAAA
jgi:hypothetical protein